MILFKCLASSILILFLCIILCVQRTGGFWLWGNEDKNKVDGHWSEWSKFSSCQNDSNDGFPYRYRTRHCNNPAPKAGGKPCKGQSIRNAPCSDCNSPLGIENKIIKDSQIRASSFHEEFPSKNARLNGPSAWCAKRVTGELFLQVDFESLTLVTAIATQGYYPDPKELSLRLGSVSKYQITFSDDGIIFEVYEDTKKNKVFIGNGNNLKTVLNILDPNIAAKHIRIHPTSYIKFVCMKFELYGCRFKCGGYLPKIPGDLLAVSSETEDIDCFWQAHLPNSSKVNFDFINFNLPCEYGQVEVRGSYKFYGGSKELGRYCDYTLSPPTITSNGNKLWIRHQSTSSDPLVGFYGIYFPNCDTVLNSTQGTFYTPNYPKLYIHNSKCSWLISVPAGKAIMLEFLDFDVEKGADCKNDYLLILDANSTVIGQYCNSNRPPRLLCSNSNTLKLHFKSDDVLSLRGFLVNYKAIKAGEPCIMASSSSITPTPTIQVTTSSISIINTMIVPSLTIRPTSTVSVYPSVLINSSIGVPLTINGVQRPGRGAHPKKDNDDKEEEEDNGLTTIIIISVFSFIVFCMLIASIIPSLIHRYEKRKREREWSAAAAELSVKKNSVIQNEYELQPIRPCDNNKNGKPNEETAFLDPDNVSIEENDGLLPCLTENETDRPHSSCEDNEDSMAPTEDDNIIDDCELEYDTTDLNLSASYEDLGSSFATEMAALLNNYDVSSPKSNIPPVQNSDELSPELDNDNNIHQCNEIPVPDNTPELNGQNNDDAITTDKMKKADTENDPKNEKLQKALSDLKETLANVNDSESISEIDKPETCTNSTASITDDMQCIPEVGIQPVWERDQDESKQSTSTDSYKAKHSSTNDLHATDYSGLSDNDTETCV